MQLAPFWLVVFLWENSVAKHQNCAQPSDLSSPSMPWPGGSAWTLASLHRCWKGSFKGGFLMAILYRETWWREQKTPGIFVTQLFLWWWVMDWWPWSRNHGLVISFWRGSSLWWLKNGWYVWRILFRNLHDCLGWRRLMTFVECSKRLQVCLFFR